MEAVPDAQPQEQQAISKKQMTDFFQRLRTKGLTAVMDFSCEFVGTPSGHQHAGRFNKCTILARGVILSLPCLSAVIAVAGVACWMWTMFASGVQT
jgi:hypothetical protein